MANPHEALTGVILAGGKSTRFGSDKASAMLAGRTLLQWVASALEPACEALVVVSARGQQLPPVESRLTVRVVEDRYEALGPLAGMVAGFAAAETPLAFVASCDVPLLRPELVRFLSAACEGHDIACPRAWNLMQPLLAAYRPATCLPVFTEFVERGTLKITAAYEELDTVVIDEPTIRDVDPDLVSFMNANRREVLEEIAERLSKR